jgi:hypothetical protein
VLRVSASVSGTPKAVDASKCCTLTVADGALYVITTGMMWTPPWFAASWGYVAGRREEERIMALRMVTTYGWNMSTVLVLR